MKREILLLLCALMLAGCAQTDGTASGNSSTDTAKTTTRAEKTADDQSADNETDEEEDLAYYLWDYSDKVEYCEGNYPGKTVLTWLRDSTNSHEQELNDYLYSNDYDYVICFRVLEYDSENTYLSQIKELSESGESFDILSSFGTVTGQDVVSNSYYYLAREGYFEPLDDVITQDKYADYYSLMPEKYWDSYKFDGSIYGVDNSFSTLMPDYGYEISSDIYEECGLSADDFSADLSGCENAFKAIYENSGIAVNIYRTFDTYDLVLGNFLAASVAVLDGEAVNVFETDSVQNYFVTLNDLSQKGYITINSDSLVFAGNNTTTTATDDEAVTNTVQGMTKVYPAKSGLIWNPTNANGVYSGSENKELAADALMKITYDSELNNIVTFGTEGVSYSASDGVVTMNEGYENAVSSGLNNPMVSYEYFSEDFEITNKDFAGAYENAEYADSFGFLFDGTEIADAYRSVVNLTAEFNPENEDISAYLEEFNNQLYDAGMQEVLIEANKQLDEWREAQ